MGAKLSPPRNTSWSGASRSEKYSTTRVGLQTKPQSISETRARSRPQLWLLKESQNEKYSKSVWTHQPSLRSCLTQIESYQLKQFMVLKRWSRRYAQLLGGSRSARGRMNLLKWIRGWTSSMKWRTVSNPTCTGADNNIKSSRPTPVRSSSSKSRNTLGMLVTG